MNPRLIALTSVAFFSTLAAAQCLPRAYSIGLGMRVAPAVLVHPQTGDIWMYGSAWSAVYNDTWVRHNGTWSLLHTGGPALGQMEFDPLTQAPLMVAVLPSRIEASRWTGEFWRTSEIPPPPNRALRNVVWALNRSTGAWWFTGTWTDTQTSTDTQELWELSGGNWTRLAVGGPDLPVHMSHAPQRGRLVAANLLADYYATIKEWDGSQWLDTAVHDANLASARRSTITSDGRVLFAGYAFGVDPSAARSWDGLQLSALPPVGSFGYGYTAFERNGALWCLGGLQFVGGGAKFQCCEMVNGIWTIRENGEDMNTTGGGAWSPILQEFVVFGGLGSAANYQSRDTFLFRGSVWEKLTTSTRPIWRRNSAVGIEPLTGNVMLFGGVDSGASVFRDAWRFDGRDWTQMTGPIPDARTDAMMATDTARNRLVMSGGMRSDTWEWDGAQWLQFNSGATTYHTSMVYDPVRHICVSFSGNVGSGSITYRDTTRIWNGATWTSLTLPGPQRREGYVAYFDDALGGIVMSGGWYTYLVSISRSETIYYNDTWLFNGTSWQQIPNAYLGFTQGQMVSPRGNGQSGAIGSLSMFLSNEIDAVRIFTSAPYIFRNPATTSTSRGGPIDLTAGVAGNHDELTFRWLHNGQPVTDDSRVSGSLTTHLHISNASTSDSGSYALRVTSPCTSTTSDPAALQICFADFNLDGTTDFFDYLDFLNAFNAGSHTADINQDGTLDLFDYLDFVDHFASGC